MNESVQFSHLVMSNSLRPHGLQHSRPPCPSPTPGACSNSCPSSQWCHPTISSSVIPCSCLQYFLASGSCPMSQFFTSGGQNIGVSASASVLPMNIQDRFPLGLTSLISSQPNTMVQNDSCFFISFVGRKDGWWKRNQKEHKPAVCADDTDNTIQINMRSLGEKH